MVLALPPAAPDGISLEAKFSVRSGINLAAKIWGDEVGPDIRILALHGWQDNSGSFDLLAPMIVKASPVPIQVVCLDFAGHGRSDHRRNGVYEESDYLFDLIDVVLRLRWRKFTVIGHSMGGAQGLLLAAALHDRVDRLVLIDTVGPWSRSPDQTIKSYRKAVSEYVENATPTRREFKTRREGAERLLSLNRFLSPRSAEILMRRGMVASGDGYQFAVDIRVRATNLRRFSEEQMRAIIASIECPVLVVRCEGKVEWEVPLAILEQRIALFKQAQVVRVQAGHHFHLDEPEQAFAIFRPFLFPIGKPPARAKL